MARKRPPCVFPSPTELELGVVPGDEPGTAIRVRVEPGRDGYARLEQLAYGEDVGWYVQKSFCVPGDMIKPLVTQLRKADCFVEKDTHSNANDAPIPFPGTALPSASEPTIEKRNA